MAEVRSSSVVAGLDWGVRWVSGEGGGKKDRVVENGEPFDSSEVWNLNHRKASVKTRRFRRFRIDSVPDRCGRCEDVEGWVIPSPCGVQREMGGNSADLGCRQRLKIGSKMTIESTRPETAMTTMRVVLRLTTAIPCANSLTTGPGVRGRG